MYDTVFSESQFGSSCAIRSSKLVGGLELETNTLGENRIGKKKPLNHNLNLLRRLWLDGDYVLVFHWIETGSQKAKPVWLIFYSDSIHLVNSRMGNVGYYKSLSYALFFYLRWGLSPRKLSEKRSKRKGKKTSDQYSFIMNTLKYRVSFKW